MVAVTHIRESSLWARNQPHPGEHQPGVRRAYLWRKTLGGVRNLGPWKGRLKMTEQKGISRRRTYRIVVRGEFGELLSSAFGEMSALPHQGTTILMADVADVSEFYGVLDRLGDFAIELISVNELERET